MSVIGYCNHIIASPVIFLTYTQKKSYLSLKPVIQALPSVSMYLELHSLLHDGVCHTKDVTESESLQGRPFGEAKQSEHVQPVVLRQMLTSHVLQNWHQVLKEGKRKNENEIYELYLSFNGLSGVFFIRGTLHLCQLNLKQNWVLIFQHFSLDYLVLVHFSLQFDRHHSGLFQLPQSVLPSKQELLKQVCLAPALKRRQILWKHREGQKAAQNSSKSCSNITWT